MKTKFKTCVQCKKKFERKASSFNGREKLYGRTRFYCSHNCYGEFRKGLGKKTKCEWCGDEFPIKVSYKSWRRLTGSVHQFCSWTCRNNASKQHKAHNEKLNDVRTKNKKNYKIDVCVKCRHAMWKSTSKVCGPCRSGRREAMIKRLSTMWV